MSSSYSRFFCSPSLHISILLCLLLVYAFPRSRVLRALQRPKPKSAGSKSTPSAAPYASVHTTGIVSSNQPPASSFKPVSSDKGNVNNVDEKRQSNCFRILLIVIFNHPHYESIWLLKELYSRVFHSVVFFGPVENLAEGVRLSLDKSGGHYQQRTAVRAMKEHPNYDGYLWIGDDVWLNYAQILLAMDRRKIWLSRITDKNWIDERNYKRKPWPNWGEFFGIPAVRRQYKNIPKKFLDRMAEALGEPDMVLQGYSDVGYVPRRFATDFINVAGSLSDVFFEIAIPTSLFLVSKAEEREYFSNPVTLWYDGKRNHPRDFWSPNVTFLHPLKLSNPQNLELARNWTEVCGEVQRFVLPNWSKC